MDREELEQYRLEKLIEVVGRAEKAEESVKELVAKCNTLYDSREVVYRKLEMAEKQYDNQYRIWCNTAKALDLHKQNMTEEAWKALCAALHP